MIKIRQKGNFQKTERFLKQASNLQIKSILEKYARQGVAALERATPVDSGLTANSWGYEISISKNGCKIAWTNTNMAGDIPLAILIQYGHGTKNGGYVQGIDYINPALRPIFEQMTNQVWREVTK